MPRNSPKAGRPPLCKACAGGRVRWQGTLPAKTTFGGREMPSPLDAGSLWHCLQCDLFFRHPYLSQETLTDLYRALPPNLWQAEPERDPSWQALRSCCEQYSASRVILDVGCFNGDFLAGLSDSWEKFGIEPGVAAGEMAARRGVTILSDSVDSLLPPDFCAGVITMIDVIEHLEHPLSSLGRLRGRLSHGGSIVIFTGATDSFGWRLFGADYWYCSVPEHVSFFSRKWFEWAAGKLGMRLAEYRPMSSLSVSWGRGMAQFARISAYTAVQKLRRSGCPDGLLRAIPLVRKPARWTTVPWWREASDHALTVLTS